MPAMPAAASTSGLITPSGVGTTMTTRPTPATRAGIAFISTELGIGGGTAGHVEPHGIDRAPAQAQPHAGIVDPSRVLGQLAPMERADALGGELQRGKGRRVAVRASGRDPLGREPQLGRGQGQPIEAAGTIDQRLVAVAAHLGDDRADHVADVGHLLAPCLDQGGERGGEPGLPIVEQQGHAGASVIQPCPR